MAKKTSKWTQHCKLINPAKSEVGKISKIILEELTQNKVRSKSVKKTQKQL